MEVIFAPKALKDAEFWKRTNNIPIQERITTLLESILQTPFEGIGKPELLKHSMSGCLSRRITQEHRLVYEVRKNKIHVLSMKGHY